VVTGYYLFEAMSTNFFVAAIAIHYIEQN